MLMYNYPNFQPHNVSINDRYYGDADEHNIL